MTDGLFRTRIGHGFRKVLCSACAAILSVGPESASGFEPAGWEFDSPRVARLSLLRPIGDRREISYRSDRVAGGEACPASRVEVRGDVWLDRGSTTFHATAA